MWYDIHYDPIVHVIFYDIFTQDQRTLLLNEFKKLDDKFYVGDYNDGKSSLVNPDIKRNYNFWPYVNRDIESSNIIIDTIENLVWSDNMRNIYKQVKDSLFLFYDYTNYSQILISKYQKDSVYEWHKDLLKSITLNFWLSEDAVHGGNFQLIHNDIIKEIKYRDNTLIAFPSECMHRVTRIENHCTRYSIQYFSSYMSPVPLKS